MLPGLCRIRRPCLDRHCGITDFNPPYGDIDDFKDPSTGALMRCSYRRRAKARLQGIVCHLVSI